MISFTNYIIGTIAGAVVGIGDFWNGAKISIMRRRIVLVGGKTWESKWGSLDWISRHHTAGWSSGIVHSYASMRIAELSVGYDSEVIRAMYSRRLLLAIRDIRPLKEQAEMSARKLWNVNFHEIRMEIMDLICRHVDPREVHLVRINASSYSITGRMDGETTVLDLKENGNVQDPDHR